MTRNPIVAPAYITVERLLEEWVYPNRCSTFPVVDTSGRLTGLMTLTRVKRVPVEQRRTTTLDQVAAPLSDVVSCAPGDSLAQIAQLMAVSTDQRALVFDGGRLVGIVSPSDVTRAHEHARLAHG